MSFPTRIACAALLALSALAARPVAAQDAPPPSEPRRPPLAVPGAPNPPGFRRGATPAPKPPATLEQLLATTPADSLAAPLRRFEAEHGRTPLGAEAAFVLGQFHYARGEYRQAGDAFARAAARFTPERKPEARYWQGLAALGRNEPTQARAALEEVVEQNGRRRDEARFGIAEAWEKAGRPERAAEELRALVAAGEGPMIAPALERLAALGRALGDEEAAQRAERELQKEHPLSIEASRLPDTPPAPVAPPPASTARAERGRVGVQIGAFSDAGRARALLLSARRAGFERTAIVRQGQGGTELHLVQLGWFAGEPDAREAGERASRELGVAYRLIRP